MDSTEYKKEVIFESKFNKITYYKRKLGSDVVVVAFGDIGSGLIEEGFGSHASFDLGVDYIYVAQRPWDQYQFLSYEFLAELLKPYVSQKRTINYGSSLGGYCALYYSGALNSDVLAYSPRLPCHPTTNALMRGRFKNTGYKHKPLNEVPVTSREVKVFFDSSNEIDSHYVGVFVKKIYPAAEYFDIVGAGHYTAEAVKLSGFLKEVFRLFVFEKTLRFSIDNKKIFEWNKKRFLFRLDRQQMEYALEHLKAVISSPLAVTHDEIVFYSDLFDKAYTKLSSRNKGFLERNEVIYPCFAQNEQSLIDNSVSLLFAGDLILLRRQLLNLFNSDLNEFNFAPIFSHVLDYIAESDYSIGVLEGPLAGSHIPYSTSSYADGIPLRLNYPDKFCSDIKDAGFDLLTTAQNHLLDNGVEGAIRTVDILENIGLDHVGAYRSEKEYKKPKVVNISGLKVGILAYTFPCNGYTSSDFFDEGHENKALRYMTKIVVNPGSVKLGIDEDFNLNEAKNRIVDDFDSLKAEGPDCILVLSHMGKMFRDTPDFIQNYWYDFFIEQGADIILNDHSHRVQPFEWRDKEDENGNSVKCLIVNCPGHFVNSYVENDGDLSALAQVYLDPKTAKPVAASAVPLYAHAYQGQAYVPIPIHKLVYEEDSPLISEYEFSRISETHEIFTESVFKVRLPIDQVQNKYYCFPHLLNKDNPAGYARQKSRPIALPDLKSNLFLSFLSESKHVCFIGDSVTHGTRNGGYGWFEPIVSNFTDLTVSTFAVGGMTSPYILKNLDQVLCVGADLYVFAIGANDVRYRNDRKCAMTQYDYVDILDEVANNILSKFSCSKFVFVAPWCSDLHDPISVLDFDEREVLRRKYGIELKRFCSDNGFVFIDPNDYIQEVFQRKDPRYYLLDHIHPNANEGVRLYSEAVSISSSF